MRYNKITLVFPGQGSQYAGMGKKLFDKFEVVRDLYDQSSQALGYDVSKKCFEEPKLIKRIMHSIDLDKAIYAQPAVLTTSYVCFRTLKEVCEQSNVDLNVSILAGHSVGEYTAFLVSGAMDFKTCLNLVQKRATYLTELCAAYPGAGLMAIVDRGREMNRGRIKSLCDNFGVYIAYINTKSQIVVGGLKKRLKRLSKEMKKQGKLAKMLNIEGPFHTPMMKQAADKFMKELNKTNLCISSIPIIANVTKEAIVDPSHIRKEIFEQIYNVVDWRYSIEKVIGNGCDLFIEVGPGRVLSNMIEAIDSSIPKLNVEDLQSLEKTVKELAG